MKGIEITTGKRLSEVVEEFVDESCKVAVWIGPGHVEEFVKGVPNCMVIDSKDNDVKEKLVKEIEYKNKIFIFTLKISEIIIS